MFGNDELLSNELFKPLFVFLKGCFSLWKGDPCIYFAWLYKKINFIKVFWTYIITKFTNTWQNALRKPIIYIWSLNFSKLGATIWVLFSHCKLNLKQLFWEIYSLLHKPFHKLRYPYRTTKVKCSNPVSRLDHCITLESLKQLF